jgi:hypothetical protein
VKFKPDSLLISLISSLRKPSPFSNTYGGNSPDTTGIAAEPSENTTKTKEIIMTDSSIIFFIIINILQLQIETKKIIAQNIAEF